MKTIGEQAWACAAALVGVPFRLQGRSAETGLDCIGLVLAAFAGAGVRLVSIDSYALRGFPLADALRLIDASGLVRTAMPVERGDVGLFQLPARQLHLALLAPCEMIHADAGQRCVCAAPQSRLPEPAARWRCE
jgi:lipoprotein Spr